LISVNIICKNEEENLEDCISSVLWADEIIVVDGESTDKSVDIARKYTNNIYINKWEGFAKQRSYALGKSTKDWVLVLDADERCSPELKEEIISILDSNNIVFNGFRVPRKNYFLGKWIKHGGWYPGYQYRFFNRNFTTITDRLVHEGYVIDGQIGTLKSDILHYTVQSVFDFMKRVNKYSSLQAEEKSIRKTVKFNDLLLRPVAAFFVQFFIRGGFKDGIHGLMVTNFDVITNMLTYMKIWELQNKEKSKK
jgi:glycosyltransferase involved in cell wall biosynthesis